MYHEQWALTVIKLLRFFSINICCFSTRLYIFFVPQWHSQPSFMKWWMFLISTPHKTRTFTVQLAVATKYQWNGFAAEVLLGRDYPRVVPIGPIVRGVIGNMMGCDHLSCVPVGPFAGELWHFEYFPTTTVHQLLIFDHMTVTVVRICCSIPNFIKIGSPVRLPDAHTAECPERRC